MLVRVGSLQTHDEFWVNPDHVVSIRVDRTSKAATIKLSDGSTHNVKTGTGAASLTVDLGKLLSEGPGAVGRPVRPEVRRESDVTDPGRPAAPLTPSATRPTVLDAQTLLTGSRSRSAG